MNRAGPTAFTDFTGYTEDSKKNLCFFDAAQLFQWELTFCEEIINRRQFVLKFAIFNNLS